MINSSKKAAALYQEIVPTALSLIIIGFVMFSFFAQTSSAEEKYTFSAPDIPNTFPITFVHTFLYQKLNQEQKVSLNFNLSKTVYLIDILEQKQTPQIKKIYEEIKTSYISSSQSLGILKNYEQSPSSLILVDQNQLLSLKSVSSLSELDCLEKNNYYFALPNIDNLHSNINIVLFMSSTSCATDYASSIASTNLN